MLTQITHKGTQTIETERLILRRFTEEDAEAMYQNWASDDDVSRFLRWETHKNLEESQAVIGRWINEYSSDKRYHWVICPKNGEAIGAVGAFGISEYDCKGELGYCIGKAFWGNGYMAEAVKAVIGFMFSEVGLNRIEAYHSVNNPASGRVMQKSGMTYEGSAKQKYYCREGFQNCDCYGILKEEWEKS